jgi:hypothetical protein
MPYEVRERLRKADKYPISKTEAAALFRIKIINAVSTGLGILGGFYLMGNANSLTWLLIFLVIEWGVSARKRYADACDASQVIPF